MIYLEEHNFYWMFFSIVRGKTKGLFVMSFPTYPKKESVFPLYTSFINPRIDVNVHTQSEMSFVSTP